jgi:hypothetical protein
MFGLTVEDVTYFFLLLVPFALSWAIGFFGFSSIFVVAITVFVYVIFFSKQKYNDRHSYLQQVSLKKLLRLFSRKEIIPNISSCGRRNYLVGQLIYAKNG